MLDELRGEIGNRLYGYTYVVDIINTCPLRCPTCAIGVLPLRDARRMEFDMFRRILDKGQREGKIRKMQLYIYSDPCLHKELHKFLVECTVRNIPSSISTMLQTTRCDFEKVVEARPTEFRISFAGWKNLTTYQKGGTVESFERKLEMVTKLPRHKETRWTMYFHIYRDNLDEIAPARKMAKLHGLDFIPYPAIMMINEKVVEKTYTEEDRKTLDLLLETPEENIERLKVNTDYCQMQRKQITIDANGMVYLCQIVYEDRFQIVPFLETPMREIRKRLKAHPFCVKCKSVGGHTYQYLYADSTVYDDPITVADQKRFKGGDNRLRKFYV